MRVRAANPKRRNTRPPRTLTPRPRLNLPQQTHITSRPINMRRRLIHMQRLRQQPKLKRLHHLNHTSNTRSSLSMTNIRLHRPQPQRTTPTPLPISRQQRLRLNRITQPRTSPMPLNNIHIHPRQTRIHKRLRNHPLLRRTIRSSQPITRPILIHSTPTHHPQYPMTQTPRNRQTLQHHQPHTLRPTHTISSTRKRLAPTIHSQPTLTTKRHKHRRRRQHRHPTRQRQRTLPRTHRLTRQMQRHQRRRTRRIHRHRRTLKPQRIRHTTRHHTPGSAKHHVALGLCGFGPRAGTEPIILIHHTSKHPSPTPPQRHRINTTILKRLPRHLQQQPLLRIHRNRLTTTNPKKPSIKLPRPTQKPTLTHITRTQTIRIKIKQPLQIPPTINRKPTNRIPTPQHQPPQIPRRTNTTRKTTTHTHNRHRLIHNTTTHTNPRHTTNNPNTPTTPNTLNQPHQKPRNSHRRRIIKHQRRRQLQPRQPTKTITQLHRTKRIKPKIPKRQPRHNILKRLKPQHHRNLTTHQLQHHTLPPLPRHTSQPPRQRPTTTNTTPPPNPHNTPQQRRQQPHPRQPTQPPNIQPHHHHQTTTGRNNTIKQLKPLLLSKRQHPQTPQSGYASLLEPACHSGFLGP